jgi:hypothetical protein
VRYNGGTSTIFNSDVSARSFSPSNTVATTYSINALDDQANSVFQVNFGTANIAGDINSTQSVSASGFFKYPVYTAAALTAITGQVGWTAAVSNSSSGGNPNGMIAFWDTTNSRWSYVHDNSAV